MTAAFADIQDHLERIDDVLLFESAPFNGLITKQLEGRHFEKKYLNGVLHGIQKEFFPDGQLRVATLFTNGLENGRHIEYYECGSKKLNANYCEGHLEGLYEEWFPTGQIITRRTYYHGKLIAVKTNH